MRHVEQAKDEASGKDYFYNSETGVTQWEVHLNCCYFKCCYYYFL